jgi:hypothetical protein
VTEREFIVTRKCFVNCKRQNPVEVIDFFFSIYLSLAAVLGPGVYSASNRNEYQKQKKVCEVERGRYVGLTAICEPIVWTMWDPQHLTTL